MTKRTKKRRSKEREDEIRSLKKLKLTPLKLSILKVRHHHQYKPSRYRKVLETKIHKLAFRMSIWKA